jgi:hypothetical protein
MGHSEKGDRARLLDRRTVVSVEKVENFEISPAMIDAAAREFERLAGPGPRVYEADEIARLILLAALNARVSIPG